LAAPDTRKPAETKPGTDKKWTWRRRASLAAAISCWFYLLGVLAVWLFIRTEGDRWWLATMVLFGPRWTMLLPLALLVPWSIFLRRRWLWGLLGLGFVVGVPIMDLRITRRGLFPEQRRPDSLRILTFNTHFIATDAVKLKALIDQTKPDLIALQEWYPHNREILFSDPSWHTVELNEAILASHYPIRSEGFRLGEADSATGVTYRYIVYLPDQPVAFYSVHLSSPHTAFRHVLHRSPQGVPQLTYNSTQRLSEASFLNQNSDDDTILAGDFNLPRDSTVFRSEFSEFTDAFTVSGLGYGWSYYSRWTAVRIDHILMGKNWLCQNCWVGPDVGSPHRPLIADLVRLR
jgi:vancomycin resistance protein VanJ